MNNLVFAIIFLILALIGVVIKKTYYYLPVKEIKRRAKKGDHLAKVIYRAVAYDNDLSVLLWLYVALTTTIGLVLLARQASFIVSVIIGSVVLWLYFSFLPSSRITRISTTITEFMTPVVSWILYYTHPVLSKLSGTVEARYIHGAHSRLFEKVDLIELVDRQKFQDDNRIDDELLHMVKKIIGLDNMNVGDVMTPEHDLKTVLADDTIGPILIDELHKTKQDYVLVRDSPKGQIVGSLAYKKLSIKSTGQVKNLMDKNIGFINEEDSLTEAFNAFIETSQPVFVVINSHEKTIGVLTINSLLKQIIVAPPKDSINVYDDPNQVAHKYDKVEQTDDEASEEKAGTSVNETE